MKNLKTVTVSIVLCICVVVACTREEIGGGTSLTPDQNAAKTGLEEQMKEAAKTAQTYHAMDNPTLLNHLVEQSKALREPFNSLAYRELKTRTNVDPNGLTALVKANVNAAGLLPLLLLRQVNQKSYMELPAETRAAVLTDSLQASRTFNTWGIPGFYLEDASNAMIETGPSAVPALKRMLNDCRPAPVFGSQEYMLWLQNKYRLCDYALFYLKRIEGDEKFTLPKSVEERDALMKQPRR